MRSNQHLPTDNHSGLPLSLQIGDRGRGIRHTAYASERRRTRAAQLTLSRLPPVTSGSNVQAERRIPGT